MNVKCAILLIVYLLLPLVDLVLWAEHAGLLVVSFWWGFIFE